MSAHAAGIKRLAYDARRRLLVSLSYDRTVLLWATTPRGELVQRCRSSIPGIVWPRSCAFLGDDRLVFGTFGSAYATWNFVRDEWAVDDIEPDLSLNAVTVHDDKTYTIGDAGILLCDGEPISKIGSLCNFLLPFGRALLAGGQLGTVFEATSGRQIHQHRSPLNCGTTFIVDGQQMAVIGTYTGEGLIFRLANGGKPEFVAETRLHDNAVKGVAANHGQIFSVCATAAAAIHRVDDFKLERHIPRAHDRIANGCAAIVGGFASIGRDLKLRLWIGGHREVIGTPHANSVKCLAASPDGRTIATGSYAGSVAVFDLNCRRWVKIARPTASGISCLCPAGGDGKEFLASSYDGHLYRISYP